MTPTVLTWNPLFAGRANQKTTRAETRIGVMAEKAATYQVICTPETDGAFDYYPVLITFERLS